MAKKVTFEVHGPYEVATHPDSRVITKEEGTEFFRGHPHLSERRGAYVFGVRSGGGITPVYVGQAKRGYAQECFTADKGLKYTLGLAAYEKGTPVLFFVAVPRKKGPTNEKVIHDLEDFLIQNAKAKNPDLVNKRGAKEANWAISGVIRSGQGKPSEAARIFRSMMGFEK